MASNGRKNGSAKPPKSTRRLKDLMAQAGVAIPSDATRSRENAEERQVRRLARAFLEAEFARLYVEAGFNHVDAYQRLRAVQSLPEVGRNQAMRSGRRWIRAKRVLRLVLDIMGKRHANVTERLAWVLDGIEADIESDVFSYLERGQVPIPLKDSVQMIAGVVFTEDATKLSKHQRIAVREIALKNGKITKAKLVDRQAAQKMYGEFLQLRHALEKSLNPQQGTGGALRERIARAKEVQLAEAKRLAPPLNVREFKVVGGKDEKPAELIPSEGAKRA